MVLGSSPIHRRQLNGGFQRAPPYRNLGRGCVRVVQKIQLGFQAHLNGVPSEFVVTSPNGGAQQWCDTQCQLLAPTAQ